MQIYELTTKPQVNEGLWDNIKLAVQSRNFDSKIKPMAAKAYYNWKLYAKQLEKSITDPVQKKNFINRTDGRYEKELISYVQKNLLGGQYLPNLNNHDDILNTIKKLSAPIGAPSPSQTGSGYVATYQPPAAKPTAAKPPAAATAKPTQPAGQLTPAEYIKRIGAPDLPESQDRVGDKTSITEAAALSEKEELELWQALVRQAATASTVVQTRAAQAPAPTTAAASARPQQFDSQQSSAFIIQNLANHGIKPDSLKAIGGFAVKSLAQGKTDVRSTGNPAADGLLVSMGFRIL